MTFSINIGSSTEAYNYNLLGSTSSNLSDILYVLKDNFSKEISPKDIRDTILTIYSSSPFKETTSTASTTPYIGIDTLNPTASNNDYKNKILIGKRSYSGTYSYYDDSQDIMTNTLLNSDVDIFLYNTKLDSVSNSRTRVSILSGTNSSLYLTAPYLQSQVVQGQGFSMDIINPSVLSGDSTSINIESINGTVSINDIIFPTILESTTYHGLTAANGKVLSWNNGKLDWNDLVFTGTNYIGITGSQTNIYGSPVNINGYPLEFTDTRYCPITIGDVQIGTSFSNYPISELLRRIVYPYLPPNCSISILPPYSSGYVEVGTSPVIQLSYKIEKRTLSTNLASLSNMIPSSYLPITTPTYTTVTGVANGVLITPAMSTTTNFQVSVGDGTQTSTASTSVTGIYPYFYGFSPLSIMTTAGLASLTKLVEPQSNKDVDIFGSGNLYFIQDNDYPVLSNVFDELGNTISSSFSSTTLTLSSPTGLWASKQFRVYQWNGVPQIGPPTVQYRFEY